MPNTPGQLPAPDTLVNVPRLITAYYALHPDAVDPRPARRLRHLRPPRQLVPHQLQRRPHRRHHAGHRRVPHGPTASPARSSSRRIPTRSRSPPSHTALEVLAANERRCDGRFGAGLHADAGALARHPDATTRTASRRPGRRHRHHALAQPARGWRLQVQPAQRRPGRHHRHQVDRKPRQRPDRRQACVRASSASPTRRRSTAADHAPPRLPDRLLSTTSPTSSTSTCCRTRS